MRKRETRQRISGPSLGEMCVKESGREREDMDEKETNEQQLKNENGI